MPTTSTFHASKYSIFVLYLFYSCSRILNLLEHFKYTLSDVERPETPRGLFWRAGAHHLDLMFEDPADPPCAKQARDIEEVSAGGGGGGGAFVGAVVDGVGDDGDGGGGGGGGGWVVMVVTVVVLVVVAACHDAASVLSAV